MQSIIGTVLLKEKKKGYKKAELVIEDDYRNKYPIQVRKNQLDKIIEVDTGDRVRAFYRVDMSEKFLKERQETNRIANYILTELEILN